MSVRDSGKYCYKITPEVQCWRLLFTNKGIVSSIALQTLMYFIAVIFVLEITVLLLFFIYLFFILFRICIWKQVVSRDSDEEGLSENSKFISQFWNFLSSDLFFVSW